VQTIRMKKWVILILAAIFLYIFIQNPYSHHALANETPVTVIYYPTQEMTKDEEYVIFASVGQFNNNKFMSSPFNLSENNSSVTASLIDKENVFRSSVPLTAPTLINTINGFWIWAVTPAKLGSHWLNLSVVYINYYDNSSYYSNPSAGIKNNFTIERKINIQKSEQTFFDRLFEAISINIFVAAAVVAWLVWLILTLFGNRINDWIDRNIGKLRFEECFVHHIKSKEFKHYILMCICTIIIFLGLLPMYDFNLFTRFSAVIGILGLAIGLIFTYPKVPVLSVPIVGRILNWIKNVNISEESHKINKQYIFLSLILLTYFIGWIISDILTYIIPPIFSFHFYQKITYNLTQTNNILIIPHIISFHGNSTEFYSNSYQGTQNYIPIMLLASILACTVLLFVLIKILSISNTISHSKRSSWNWCITSLLIFWVAVHSIGRAWTLAVFQSVSGKETEVYRLDLFLESTFRIDISGYQPVYFLISIIIILIILYFILRAIPDLLKPNQLTYPRRMFIMNLTLFTIFIWYGFVQLLGPDSDFHEGLNIAILGTVIGIWMVYLNPWRKK
jgi:hypothetical protein